MGKRIAGLLVLFIFVGIVVWGCGQGKQATVTTSTTLTITSTTTTTTLAGYTGLSITPEQANLLVGETQQFRVSGLVKSSAVTTNEVEWAVTGAVGTINATGLFTATAEGTGTVEARVDSLVGNAMVTVTGGKTISGKVTDLTCGDPLSGVLIYAGGKTAITDSSGNYTLKGVSLSAESITVQLGNYTPTTIYTTKESVDIELSLIPNEQSGPLGYMSPNSTINGEVRDENGNLVSGTVALQHKYYFTTGYVSNGKFSVSCYVDPKKLPMEAFLSYGTSSKAGIERILIQSTGAIEIGTLEVNSNPGIVSGEVSIPYETHSYSPGYISWRIMDNSGRFYTGYGSSSLSNSKTYTIYLPPTPAAKKYYLKVEGRSSNYSYFSSQYIEDFEIASGESKVVNFAVPNFITAEAPADGTTSVSTMPVFSWTPPASKFNLYVVFLFEGGGSSYLKWAGVTDQTSITYPSFASGSGFESLNLDSNKGYIWQVYGYYVPNFSLQANRVKVASILESSHQGVKSFSGNNAIRTAAVDEIFQALEQTMSKLVYFGTGSVQHVTTTTTTSTSTTTTTSAPTTTTTIVKGGES